MKKSSIRAGCFKYILADNFTCMVDGEIMGTVSPEVIEKMPKAN